MDAGGAVLPQGRLGNCELLHRLAVGGMGEVFLARHRALAGVTRLVALKRLLPDYAEQPGSVELFIDEARVAANLAHPNIVQVHDFGNERGTYYLTMELVAGQNLDRVFTRGLARGAPLARPLAIHAIGEMLRGLAHAHAARDAHGASLGIVHRDISPHNVLVSYAGDVKLMDFGIARSTAQSHRTRTGTVRGKPAYMSPEQVTANVVDARTDVYSTGVMLWELTLGRRLHTGDDLAIVQRVADQAVPSPVTIDPGYPPALAAIVMAAVERRPEDRIADASALGAALREYLAATAGADPASELGRTVRGLFADEAGALEALIRDASAPPPPGVLSPSAPTEVVAAPGLAATVPIRGAAAPSPAVPAPARRRWWPIAAGAAALAVAGFVLARALDDDPAPAVSSAAATDAAPVPVPVPVPDPETPHTTTAPPPDAAPPDARPARPRDRGTLADRLSRESRDRLADKLRADCASGGDLPSRIKLAMMIDKFGRPRDADVIAEPGTLSSATEGCVRRWVKRWTFTPADRDATGTLVVDVR